MKKLFFILLFLFLATSQAMGQTDEEKTIRGLYCFSSDDKGTEASWNGYTVQKYSSFLNLELDGIYNEIVLGTPDHPKKLHLTITLTLYKGMPIEEIYTHHIDVLETSDNNFKIDVGSLMSTNSYTFEIKGEIEEEDGKKNPLPTIEYKPDGNQTFAIYPAARCYGENNQHIATAGGGWNGFQTTLSVPDCEIELSKTDPSFVPEGNRNFSSSVYDGNAIRYTAKLKKGLAQKLLFTLKDISQEPGLAMNRGKSSDPDYEKPDFYLKASENPTLIINSDEQSAITSEKVTTADILITSRDFGGWGSIEVKGESEKCNTVIKSFPIDQNHNRIADSASQDHNTDSQGGSHFSPTDDQDEPKNMDVHQRSLVQFFGDGLSRYEEYRGFFARGFYTRLDPAIMDVAVYRENKRFGLGWIHLVVNPLLMDDSQEMNGVHCLSSTAGSVNSSVGVKIINFNSSFAHLVNQHGLWLSALEGDRPFPGIAGLTTGDGCRCDKLPTSPGTIGRIFIYPQEIYVETQLKKGKRFQSDGRNSLRYYIDQIITHELFHGMGNLHHSIEEVDFTGHPGGSDNLPFIEPNPKTGELDPKRLDYALPTTGLFKKIISGSNQAKFALTGVGESEPQNKTCPMKYIGLDLSNSIKNDPQGIWNIPGFSPHGLCDYNLGQLKVRDY
ncbi:MAG: hypothetical protein A2Z91_06805 [Deltaproteobacteria bacterium GWA2_38_16]|nr:MAG: hypothetical protein A2Z91_06805 [Deltaproteobacteria bacterium GWA2_38_16]OGQ03381.1 MAG: hypothetical protein A3D19_04605 [Deltaproteobacteria bacterium RIFCSPHIGHO2_02_FULL_38_15]OGQ33903.1 MAG: hypothetical protein A3A72_03170 [Deltaproteobacteria bacterium RIFCSPLOWO2_01_FULL_38_9]OGQ59553.1 MAG: hypothetical protein A3G92_04605 [Deltaproteobacteria bacterium RIFCSPLOWO2_12_FULL_38_8]HBQ20657.1 hypothetical protein [Deltaproteobacteria bacterium]